MLKTPRTIRLGVNIDHVATLRNARNEGFPDPIEAAHLAINSGAYGITAHLREDRRHINDSDIKQLKNELDAPLNMEMAPTDEMVKIACQTQPHACCLVPEKRQELTTEGGLDVVGQFSKLEPAIKELQAHSIQVSLFIDPDATAIEAAKKLGTNAVELHTGEYARSPHAPQLKRLQQSARMAHSLGIDVHAGHGLTYENVEAIAAITEISELNIGHFLISQSVFCGLPLAIATMQKHIKRGIAHHS